MVIKSLRARTESNSGCNARKFNIDPSNKPPKDHVVRVATFISVGKNAESISAIFFDISRPEVSFIVLTAASTPLARMMIFGKSPNTLL